MFYQAYCRESRLGVSRRAAERSDVNKGEKADVMLILELAVESRKQKQADAGRYNSLLKMQT